MAFDSQTRNRLVRFVADARGLIADEFTQMFQSLYGLSPSGEITDLADLKHLDEEQHATAERLRARLCHLEPENQHPDRVKPETIERLVREQAFTVLNRLSAIRMAEKRAIIVESVGHGYASKGFKVYLQVAGNVLGDTYRKYCRYLFCLFDELAVDLGVLFDRRSSAGLLFVREPALLKFLELLNAPDLDSLWAEDETIGWIYQYYNDPAERKKMREQSTVPRNSRELAIRNQFFTPRYVVEFLTDNTLGRIWYEMTKGQTRIQEQCRYLVRRPNEIFLQDGETAPEFAKFAAENFSQEEILKQPVPIPHRSLKDPRSIRLLDPACGSMHFGLYAFDLFEVIYGEAWEIARGSDDVLRSSNAFAPFVAFVAQYPDKAAFLREVPQLIIEHNIHGIDIDPRCAQIAGLSLWLRAQRTWQEQRLQPTDRPHILRSNVVCAEPMPGEEVFLNEFIEAQLSGTPEKNLLGQLVRHVFEAMKLVGEAGSLLKIEEEIAAAVTDAKHKWLVGPKLEQGLLFAEGITPSAQRELDLDVTGITDETFWEKAEERIYVALQLYAELADHGRGYQRRLFVDDTVQGFAFIELCRKRYDVVVMNPPFGDPTTAVLSYLTSFYPNTKHDIATSFIEMSTSRLTKRGSVGWISSRTWFCSTLAEDFRREIIYERFPLQLVADLGIGVLDTALVETAACISGESRPETVVIFRLVSSRRKESDLLKQVDAGSPLITTFSRLLSLPRCAFGYWFPDSLRTSINNAPRFDSHLGTSNQGLATTDDFRFLRALWEVDAARVGLENRWVPFAKGGEYEPYYDDLHLVIDYEHDGAHLKEYVVSQKGQKHWSRRIASSEFYGRWGLTYPERTTSDFSPRPLPAGSIFSTSGRALLFASTSDALAFLGLCYTRIFKQILELFVGGGDASESGSAARHYTSGILSEIPVPRFSKSQSAEMARTTLAALRIRQAEFAGSEVAIDFVTIPLRVGSRNLKESITEAEAEYSVNCLRLLEQAERLEEFACDLYGVSSEKAESFLDLEVCPFPTRYHSERRRMRAELPAEDVSGLVAAVCERHGFRRAFTKKGYWANRLLELACHLFHEPPANCIGLGEARLSRHLENPGADLISYLLGCIFGRWDIRFATGEKPAPEMADPFRRLPICPPGQLQNEEGLPLTKDDVRHLHAADQWRYPLDIPWDGILVDDSGHALDIEARVHQVLQVIWKNGWEEIEREACEILGVNTLREYFRNPTGFFADHLNRYSKSRRQAPIYWPLSTTSGSYTLWLYYHRLTGQTLHTAIADFLEPKIKRVELEAQKQQAEGRTQRFGETVAFVDELKELRAEIEHVIKLHWKPNLNDGVVITASPLWKLFRFGQWQANLKTRWEELVAGKYDWAHLALSIRPDQVKEKCRIDRSIAVAHGLQELCTVEPPKSIKRKKVKEKAAREHEDV